MKNANDQRPPVWIGHVAMHSNRVAATSEFMQKIGMRLIADGDDFAVLEMRGGTHLVVTANADSDLIQGSFDLMVELGFAPGPIERGKIHDCFEVREPGGTPILFNSSHVGDQPV